MFNALPASFIGRTSDPARSSFYIGLFALLGALLVLPPPTAAQMTQTLSLDEGWNLVSLRVQPDDPSFASIFGGTDGAISSVKNEDGAAYLPALGIEQISTWQADEGYKVHAETAATIKVIGTELSPGTVAIALQEGGNIVPYLPDRVLAVEEAVMSIEESLVAVEGEDGQRYPSGATPLDSLRPGQGYKVYVDRADTLRYPIVARTLDDALALTGIPVGRDVRVQGYHRPGDGGGGLFRVTESGAETDGGTVFAFNEDVSAQQSEQLTDKVRGKSLPSKDLRWGTVEVEINGTTNKRIVDTEFLHGHTAAAWPSKGQNVPMIDHKTGTFAGRTILQGANDQLGGTGFTVRYRYITTNRRLERVGVTNAFNIDWWGAKEADPKNPVNNWWRINWAINKAKETYENRDVEWAYVDIPGHYYYRYLIRIQEGVRLRGASDQTFAPAANGKPTYGKLSLMPGLALNQLKDGWDEENIHGYLKVAGLDLTHAYMTSKVGMESLEVDGNIQNNLEPFIDSNNEYSNVVSKLQNGNRWNGFMSKPSSQWAVPDGAVVDFDNVYIHDFPGNGISGQRTELFFDPSSNVRVGDAPRNHQLYRTEGVHDGWQIDGAGWASIVKVTQGTFTDLTVNAGPNELHPYLGVSWKKVFDHHGKGFGIEWDNITGFSELLIDVDNFEVDLTDAPTDGRWPTVEVFADRGYGGEYRNGQITTHSDKPTDLVSPVGTNGNGPIRDYTYRDITVTDRGGGVTVIAGDAATHLRIDNLTLESDRSSTPSRKLFNLQSFSSGSYAEYNGNAMARRFPMGARFDVTNLQTPPLEGNTFRIWNMNGEHPMNVFVSGSVIDNSPTDRSSRFFGPTNQDRSVFVDVFRLYLNDTAFNAREPEPSYRDIAFHRYLLNPEKTLRLRNCTSPRTNRVSDASGTYTSDGGDEGSDYVLIPTNLMSLAQEMSATVTSGPRTVQSVENADANGNVQTWDPNNPEAFDPRDPYLRVNLDGPIQSGTTITIDWTTRVTPTADYQPTGVFVARPVANQSYTSGNGPFTIDLRGVASSQETQDPVRYSASSSDASVVTTSVNSYQDTDDNLIPWELELTEQGTGTATITVTATIDGVGTATDTFKVTIE